MPRPRAQWPRRLFHAHRGTWDNASLSGHFSAHLRTHYNQRHRTQRTQGDMIANQRTVSGSLPRVISLPGCDARGNTSRLTDTSPARLSRRVKALCGHHAVSPEPGLSKDSQPVFQPHPFPHRRGGTGKLGVLSRNAPGFVPTTLSDLATTIT